MSAIHEESVYVTAVRIEYAGSTLAGDHASGVSELIVDDAFEFNEGGGLLSVNGDVLTYTRWDDDTNTITLASPTSSAYDDNDRVLVSPLAPVKVADVVDIEGASYEAIVWHTLDPLLREGIREPDEQETGTILYTGDFDKVWLVNCPGKTPSIDPAAIEGGGGGGGDIDGGNDDDGFVLPTLSEFVFDGYPEFYVDADSGQVYTEDEAYDLDDAFITYIELSAGSFSYDIEKLDRVYAQTLFPAWSIPLLGQDEKITIDSATVTGVASSPTIDTIAGCGVRFGSMYDDPLYGRYFTMLNHFILSAFWDSGAMAYSDRTWYDANGNGDFPMPSSSEGKTFPVSGDLHTRGLVVITPNNWGVGGVETPSTSVAMTGIRMEQA